MASDVRLIQLARMLGLALPGLDRDGARQAIAARPEALGEALFLEAADNDDVVSADAARSYLADRLAFFGDLVSPEGAAAVTAAFEARLAAWG